MKPAWVLLWALGLGACSEGPAGGEAAARGRNIYLTQCIACHASDPSQAGPVGPPVKGSSLELLETKVVRGAYPSGYMPKRNTALMTPMPQLAASIPDLAAFLR